MRDQAEKLRHQMLKSQGKLSKINCNRQWKRRRWKIQLFDKFCLCTFVHMVKKVIIIDMDIGMGNIHILLGMAPQNSLKDYLFGSKELHEVINEAPQGLNFISGGSGLNL